MIVRASERICRSSTEGRDQESDSRESGRLCELAQLPESAAGDGYA
jgi:hypothetical protein